MRTLIFDTETTGVVDFKRLDDLDKQLRLVQLAAVLVSIHKKIVDVKAEINVLVNPRIPIPAGASKVHKIFDRDVQAFGLRPKVAAALFNNMLKSSDRIVGHNIDFDIAVMLSEYRREKLPTDMLNKGKLPRVCTMKSATPVLKLPGRYGHKWPNLGEAYSYFTGQKMENAHDALADVRATIDILVALENLDDVKMVAGDL